MMRRIRSNGSCSSRSSWWYLLLLVQSCWCFISPPTSSSSILNLNNSATSASSSFSPTLSSAARELSDLSAEELSALPKVKAVFSDVDGTLTGKNRKINSVVLEAICSAVDSGVLFFAATGKSRGGFLRTIEDACANHGMSSSALLNRLRGGVYTSGMVTYDVDGQVVYERLLNARIISLVRKFCEEKDISLIAYCDDEIYTSRRSEETDKITLYFEPMPIEITQRLEELDKGIHKLILLAPVSVIEQIREPVQKLLGDDVTLTQALPDMLEILPPGGSKAEGAKAILNQLGLSFPGDWMAMGDAENDLELLKLAGPLGVCMGNAGPHVKAAAALQAPPNSEDGAAIALRTLLKLPSSSAPLHLCER